MVNPRLVIHSFQVSQTGEPHHIVPAGLIHSQNSQMKTLLVLCRITIFAPSGRHIHFDAEDRLDTCRLRLFIKSQIAAHSAVVGHCHGLHTKLFDFTDEVIYLGQSVQHAVSGMVV